MRILIVEDEAKLADIVASSLEKDGFLVDIAYDGDDGLYNALTDAYDLVVLDVMLPGVSGVEILNEMKKSNISSKVIMATAKSELEDKLLGFDAGADDYITKPYHVEELVARINSQLKRNKTNKDIIIVGDLELNIKTCILKCTTTNETIEIMKKELLLLECFMNNKDQLLSKEQIYDKVWGIDNESESNNLEAYLSFIRKKLNAIGSNTKIKASRGLGYKLEVENEETSK